MGDQQTPERTEEETRQCRWPMGRAMESAGDRSSATDHGSLAITERQPDPFEAKGRPGLIQRAFGHCRTAMGFIAVFAASRETTSRFSALIQNSY